jgi:hypothetical protein
MFIVAWEKPNTTKQFETFQSAFVPARLFSSTFTVSLVIALRRVVYRRHTPTAEGYDSDERYTTNGFNEVSKSFCRVMHLLHSFQSQ